MIEIFKALATGIIVGAIFTLLRLPIPAPQVAAGVAGVVGVWLGLVLVTWLRR